MSLWCDTASKAYLKCFVVLFSAYLLKLHENKYIKNQQLVAFFLHKSYTFDTETEYIYACIQVLDICCLQIAFN